MAGMSDYFGKKDTSVAMPNDGIMSEAEWTNQYFSDVNRDMRSGGYMSPTDGSLKQHYHGTNIESGIQNTHNAILNYKGPSAFNKEDADYTQSRFDFIAAEEQYRNSMYMLNGVPHIGYGLNLQANGDIAKEVLKLDNKGFSKLMSGETLITERQGRLLFEAAVKDAENVVSNKLEGVPLNATQRIALVSMAYNAPALIGPNLTKHLKAGSAEDVSYEILNKSNGNGLAALDSRRKREHDMFFGYDKKWSEVSKGDDLRSGFQIASLFGISTAQAGTLNPSGRRDIYDAPIGNKPNKILAAMAVHGHDMQTIETEKSVDMPIPKPRPDRPKSKDPMMKYNNINDFAKEVYPTLFQKLTRPQVATPARAYGFYKAQKATFNFETETYGNDFFNPNEMDTLKNFVLYLESQGKTSAQYYDYDEFFGIREVNGMYLSEVVGSKDGLERIQSEYGKRGIKRLNDQELHEAAYGTDSLLGETADHYISMAKLAQDSFDPVLALGLTIGRFSFSRDDQGRIVIEDVYNFTGMRKRDSAYSKERGSTDDRGEKPAFKFRLVL